MSNKPTYENVIEKIYQFIDETQMKPGDSFPPERDLAKQWDISRNMLREAIIILEDRGVLVSRQGQGRFLRSLPTKGGKRIETIISGEITRYSLIDLYEVRQALEMMSVALAAQKATKQQIQELVELYREVSATLFRLGTTRRSGEDRLHFKYLEIADNPYLTKVLSHQLESLDLMFEKLEHLIFLHRIEDYVRDHGNIIRAIINHDPDEAQREMQRHVQTTIDILRFGK
ncbi:MAG: FadR/GntR family transcriptional regulator [Faecousia sp.]